ncbi:MAG: hypothetical protein RIC89_22990 [Pseudomonadales bacterium]
MRHTIGHRRAGRKFFKHIAAERIRERIPRQVWEGYFKFCVERNPFDKTLSHFHMRKALGEARDFDDYLDAGDLCVDYPLYTDRAGRLLVDRVLHFENLDVEFGEVMARLGLPYAGPHRRASQGRLPQGHDVLSRRHYTRSAREDRTLLRCGDRGARISFLE